MRNILRSKFYVLNSRKGFTLIEILIVVAIIGILASVVIVGLGPAQKRGRDARRASDLRSVQTALELYYGKNGAYPGGTGTGVSISDWASLQNALTGASIGVVQVPDDPTPVKHYGYATDVGGTSYILGALLDDPNNSLLNGSTDTFPSSFTVKTNNFGTGSLFNSCGGAFAATSMSIIPIANAQITPILITGPPIYCLGG